MLSTRKETSRFGVESVAKWLCFYSLFTAITVSWVGLLVMAGFVFASVCCFLLWRIAIFERRTQRLEVLEAEHLLNVIGNHLSDCPKSEGEVLITLIKEHKQRYLNG